MRAWHCQLLSKLEWGPIVQSCCLLVGLTAVIRLLWDCWLPSLVLDDCPSSLVLCLLLMFFHTLLLSSVRCWWLFIAPCLSFVLRVAVDASFVYLLVVVGLSFSHGTRQTDFQWASSFVQFQLCACGTEMRSRCTLIDRRLAEWMETDSRDLFASFLWRMISFSRPEATPSSLRLFRTVVFQSYLDIRSNRTFAGSHNNNILYCGFTSNSPPAPY